MADAPNRMMERALLQMAAAMDRPAEDWMEARELAALHGGRRALLLGVDLAGSLLGKAPPMPVEPLSGDRAALRRAETIVGEFLKLPISLSEREAIRRVGTLRVRLSDMGLKNGPAAALANVHTRLTGSPAGGAGRISIGSLLLIPVRMVRILAMEMVRILRRARPRR